MSTTRPGPAPDGASADVRALLAGLFDYAGLFPPAGLGMEETVRNFEAYRSGPHAWMLGRLVLPWSRRGEFLEALGSGDDRSPCPVTLLVPLPGDADAIDRLRSEHADFSHVSAGRIDVGALETKVADAAALRALGLAFDAFAELFPGAEVHVEATGACEVDALLDALVEQRARGADGQSGVSVRGAGKLRTGSVVPEEIPTVDDVVAFVRACAARDLPWKATAGLHHPLPATRPLTYEPDAPRGPMLGYVGVILAAAHAVDDPSIAPSELATLLTNTDPPDLDGVSAAAIRSARTRGCLSIGTCSFVEPVEGAESIGLLPYHTESHR